MNPSNGNLIWKYATTGPIESSSTVNNNTVYFGSDDGNIYALNTTNGKLIWKYKTGGCC